MNLLSAKAQTCGTLDPAPLERKSSAAAVSPGSARVIKSSFVSSSFPFQKSVAAVRLIDRYSSGRRNLPFVEAAARLPLAVLFLVPAIKLAVVVAAPEQAHADRKIQPAVRQGPECRLRRQGLDVVRIRIGDEVV